MEKASWAFGGNTRANKGSRTISWSVLIIPHTYCNDDELH
jgi:hypothetical protein